MPRMLNDRDQIVRARALQDAKDRAAERALRNITIRPDVPRAKWIAIRYVESYANPACPPRLVGPYLGMAEGDKWLWGGGPNYTLLPSNVEVIATYDHDYDDYEGAYVAFCKQFPVQPAEPRAESAWIAPDGRWFPTPIREHISYGKFLLAQEHGDYGDWQDLFTKDWICFDQYGHVLGNAEHGFSGKLTPAQFKLVLKTRNELANDRGWRTNMDEALTRDWEARGQPSEGWPPADE